MFTENALKGSLALVTGASGGLGASFSRTLARHGADLVLAGRNTQKLDQTKQMIEEKGGRAYAIELDVTKPNSVDTAFDLIEKQFDRPCDIIVNNSGVGQASWMTATDEREWTNIIDTNLSGVWRVAKRGADALVKHECGGSIINISSVTSLRPGYMISGYAASKAAVDHLSRNMALELARYGIRVNALAPGYFKTAINDRFLESNEGERMRKRITMRRFGRFEDLDAPLLLLASAAGAYITGTTLVVDGGHSLSPL